MKSLWYGKQAMRVLTVSLALMILGAMLQGMPLVESISGATTQLPTNPMQTEIGRWLSFASGICAMISLVVVLVCILISSPKPGPLSKRE